MIISLDTECTGLSVFHGCRPFFVTCCDENGNYVYWHWRVDPLTRKVTMLEEDIKEIRQIVNDADSIVLHNSKFDALMLMAAGIIKEWPWHKTEDTLMSGHILYSNYQHDLTNMSMQYLKVDIKPLEVRLGEICKQARTYCRFHLKDWRVAKEGVAELPGANENSWAADMWLPREIAIHEWGSDKTNTKSSSWSKAQLRSPFNPAIGEKKEYWTALEKYSNADSQVTLPLWLEIKERLHSRGLWNIYKERMKIIPITVAMESRGMFRKEANHEELRKVYKREAKKYTATCMSIAKSYNYDLVLPKGGGNHSLQDFCFGEPIDRKDPKKGVSRKWLDLPPVEFTKKTRSPSLNQKAMEYYLFTLDMKKRPGIFISNFSKARSRKTQLTFLRAYKRFSLPTEHEGYSVIHPNFNPTGTNTLRWSSNNPNAENVKKSEDKYESLRYIITPLPGREYYSVDAKNIELRIPFYISGEQTLIDLFERPNDPPYYGSVHLLSFHTVYEDIWNKALEEVGIEKVGPYCKKKFAANWYQWCKNGNFAKQYGGGKRKVDATFRKDGAYDLLDNRFSKLKKLNDDCIKEANEFGYVETLPDRRVDPTKGYPILAKQTGYGSILTTTPLNYKTQSTACWVIMRMAIEVQPLLDKWTKEDDRGYYLIANIHDEWVFDFPINPEGVNKAKIMECKTIMDQIGYDLIPSIPLPVGVERHANNWAEGETIC